MNKVVLLFLGLFFLSLYGNSQNAFENIEVEWGDPFNESKKSTPNSIFASDDTGFYLLSDKHRMGSYVHAKAYVSHFGNNAELLEEELLKLKIGKDEMDFEFLIPLNDVFYVFSSLIDKKEKKKIYYVQTIDKTTLKVNSDSRKFVEVPFIRRTDIHDIDFNYKLSNDSSEVIVYHRVLTNDEESSIYRYYIFNNELNIVRSREIVLPYNFSLFYIKGYVVDNNGGIHFLMKYKMERKSNSKKKEYDNYFSILSYYDDTTNDNEFKLSKNGKFIKKIKMNINESNELVIAGFYSDAEKNRQNGFFYYTFVVDQNVVLQDNYHPFDQKFLQENSVEYSVKKTEENPDGIGHKLYNFEIDKIVFKKDGGTFIMGEQRYYIKSTDTQSKNAAGRYDVSYMYFYRNIIAINIDKDGNLAWMETIAKKQESQSNSRGLSSYTPIFIGSNSYFIYNDNPENIEIPLGNNKYSSGSLKNFEIVVVEIDKDGKKKKSNLFSTDGEVVLTRPENCKQISENEVVIYLENGDIEHFAKVTFK